MTILGTPHLFEIGEVQREAGLQQDDDQRHLPQVAADCEQRRVEQIQQIGSEQDAGQQHSNDAGQPQTGAESGCGEPDEKDQCKGK